MQWDKILLKHCQSKRLKSWRNRHAAWIARWVEADVRAGADPSADMLHSVNLLPLFSWPKTAWQSGKQSP
jgi:hypothetical protein